MGDSGVSGRSHGGQWSEWEEPVELSARVQKSNLFNGNHRYICGRGLWGGLLLNVRGL